MAALRRLVHNLTQGHIHSTPKPDAITKENLFETIPPECDLECSSCTIKYPKNFKIEESDDLWNSSKPWSTHIIIATGKSDWVRDVADEKGSIMEALDKHKKPNNGKLMVSASNMHPPPEFYTEKVQPTTVILLPSWTMVENVRPNDVHELIENYINPGPTNTTPLNGESLKEAVPAEPIPEETTQSNGVSAEASNEVVEDVKEEPSTSTKTEEEPSTADVTDDLAKLSVVEEADNPRTSLENVSNFRSYECPHDYLILLCSHNHRDARCGKSAPLLLKELRRQLEPLGLYRDLDDFRPGGVGIFFINHVGGHKYTANMLIYRKKAGQGIWLARVKPQDIETIVKWTVLEGKVSPEKIRAGFDRGRGVTSW